MIILHLWNSSIQWIITTKMLCAIYCMVNANAEIGWCIKDTCAGSWLGLLVFGGWFCMHRAHILLLWSEELSGGISITNVLCVSSGKVVLDCHMNKCVGLFVVLSIKAKGLGFELVGDVVIVCKCKHINVHVHIYTRV